MASSLFSPAPLLILAGLSFSVFGVQELQRQLANLRVAKSNLLVAEARSAQFRLLMDKNANLIDEIAKLPIPPGAVSNQKLPIQERLASLVAILRVAEISTRTRVIRLQAGPSSSNAGPRMVNSLMEPLPTLPGAGVVNVNVDGTYLTLEQLSEYLSIARNTGAAISRLVVGDTHFKATFSIYARV